MQKDIKVFGAWLEMSCALDQGRGSVCFNTCLGSHVVGLPLVVDVAKGAHIGRLLDVIKCCVFASCGDVGPLESMYDVICEVIVAMVVYLCDSMQSP